MRGAARTGRLGRALAGGHREEDAGAGRGGLTGSGAGRGDVGPGLRRVHPRVARRGARRRPEDLRQLPHLFRETELRRCGRTSAGGLRSRRLALDPVALDRPAELGVGGPEVLFSGSVTSGA